MKQPIDTAPKNGTVILLYGGTPDDSSDELEYGGRDDGADLDNPPIWTKPRPVTGWWHNYARPHDGKTGQWRYCCYDDGYYGEFVNPTHWDYLPNEENL